MKRMEKRTSAAQSKQARLAEDLKSTDRVTRGLAFIEHRNLQPTDKLLAQLRLLLKRA